jgi:glucose-1-phosphate cytidylyltransferase
MKAVILAGGLGTRLSEKTENCPKPMIKIGGMPILWHIMSLYSFYGINEFIIALGYKGEMIKEFFLNYYSLNCDVTIDLSTGKEKLYEKKPPPWIVHLVDTGLHTQTGGRLKRLKKWIGNETFLFTYGDGLTDMNISKEIEFHKNHGALATVAAVRPPARFGGLHFEGDRVAEFLEKPQTGEGWINGGFFVLEPEVISYIKEDATAWEREPLEKLAQDRELMAYKYEGFWQAMDTLREYKILEDLWDKGHAPWKIWEKQETRKDLLLNMKKKEMVR